ncbi:CBS domain-containing protein [Apibacter mensalis]|uniref:CBS domain-containing protein n=1 Tax=Apibacter mensalis TaxID=1586267 RepID=A0A0X3AQG0_9FLAO|nr:CBS domain-containing protein [Apibacter mensalis]CVK16640.1 CBS domain-containing protein [Apibacter mensalis]
MIITNYISNDVLTLYESDTVAKAEQLMIDLGVSHYPVISKGKVKGNIGWNIIRDLGKSESLKDHLLDLEPFYLHDNSILFDSLHVFSENETNIIPIISFKEKFLGVVLEETVIEELASFQFITEFGVYMIITTPIKKYSTSEIANIVESNNGRILGMLLANTDEDSTQIILKISAENINSIGDTFERFGYQISNKYFEDSKQELLKERYDQLQKFMEV